MDLEFRPLLTTTDWNEEWKALQAARVHSDDAAEWDERSKTFATKHGSQSTYANRFLELAHIEPDETVLDMGCGTGAIACPLALAGNHVVAADFSEGMLGQLRSQLALDATNELVDIVKMSWADNWDEHGLGIDSVDVAIASRSIATDDLLESLTKLSRAAKDRACITLPTTSSPRRDASLERAAGIGSQMGRDFLYAFNILASMGVAPTIDYIESERRESFDDKDEAFGAFSSMVRGALKAHGTEAELAEALENLSAWLDASLVENECAGLEDSHGTIEKKLCLAVPRKVVWAFISWKTASFA